MKINLLLRIVAVVGASLFISAMAAVWYQHRASTQNFAPTREIVGVFRLEGLASNPHGRVDNYPIKFDVGAFGETQGGRAKRLPDGGLVKVSIAMIHTSQGVLPLAVKATSDQGVLFYSDVAECKQRFDSATAFVFVTLSLLSFAPALFILAFKNS